MQVTLKLILKVLEADDNLGICLSCGEIQGCVEPDARNYRCEACDEMQVFGAEELLMMYGV